MEKLGQEGAFACAADNGYQIGVTKRFYAACAAMQGMLAQPNRELRYDHIQEFIKDCYDHADELLKQENQ